uniref:Cilia- and flagella-associated protein 418 n=1 Tax=Chlamydomonas euryale TaxID=1486919 RepID=A0A7R9YQK2_9CHLO|mmetsp:Transcript_11931/g.35176  ORF Transcript_11931/g.35176 Transcript_11931/m.35176 type:complete len:109 (+) Transcript_11931:81-407(+)
MGLFIGGAHTPQGRNGASAGVLNRCNNLRCTKCDFKVIWFDNQGWLDSVDYLFLRNNFPTADKLAAKLRRSPSTSAYCCQCSWRSATDAQRVGFGGEDLRWVCAGHDL